MDASRTTACVSSDSSVRLSPTSVLESDCRVSLASFFTPSVRHSDLLVDFIAPFVEMVDLGAVSATSSSESEPSLVSDALESVSVSLTSEVLPTGLSRPSLFLLSWTRFVDVATWVSTEYAPYVKPKSTSVTTGLTNQTIDGAASKLECKDTGQSNHTDLRVQLHVSTTPDGPQFKALCPPWNPDGRLNGPCIKY